jgi:hypothetical protein
MSLRLQSRTFLFRQECPQCFPFRPFPYHAAWQHAERLCTSPLSPRTNVGRVSIVNIHFISSPQPFDTPQCEIGSDGGTSSTPRWRPSNCSLAPLRSRGVRLVLIQPAPAVLSTKKELAILTAARRHGPRQVRRRGRF